MILPTPFQQGIDTKRTEIYRLKGIKMHRLSIRNQRLSELVSFPTIEIIWINPAVKIKFVYYDDCWGPVRLSTKLEYNWI